MSTNRTENYHLHVWGAEDEESLAEINENFGTIADALAGKAKFIYGSYIGDGVDNRRIELEAQPVAVLLEQVSGLRGNGSSVYGGLFTREISLANNYVRINGTGFILRSGGYAFANQDSKTYNYLAWVKEE